MALSRRTAPTKTADAAENYEATRKRVGYVSRSEASEKTYQDLGFKCGLEIHQQLLTDKKLFCHCPAGIYQKGDDFDAELVRHMRPTLSELGEYDGTALMEFRTRKNIIYRIKNETACTYDIDDTPPFKINDQALDIAIQIALMLKTNIVGELHITRKQYLDGSIPTGFQRTAIVGIEGSIPLANKTVKIIQLSIEEDSCREVSDTGHYRTYTTDRLGMPLIESVTYPEMLVPEEAAEAAHYLRFLVRSSGRVRTGIGAARQDVNVSITGGTRVEIKGVAHIAWIPDLTHTEAFRQRALLLIRDDLKESGMTAEWKIAHKEIDWDKVEFSPDADNTDAVNAARHNGHKLVAVNLPGFASLLSFFTQPGKCLADEFSDRLKVVACLDRPNMTYSEDRSQSIDDGGWEYIRQECGASADDAQLLFWADDDDIETALITIEERGLLALEGVPNETRKALADGTTIFERVLPGPDRMYPDTDSAPIPIGDERIEKLRALIPAEVSERLEQLQKWSIPRDTHTYLLRRNLVPAIETVVADGSFEPVFVATVLGHNLRHCEGQNCGLTPLSNEQIASVFAAANERGLMPDILRELIPMQYINSDKDIEWLLTAVAYEKQSEADVLARIPKLREEFTRLKASTADNAEICWLMGKLRRFALGNVSLAKLRTLVEKEVTHD